jgi:hypothetical protein
LRGTPGAIGENVVDCKDISPAAEDRLDAAPESFVGDESGPVRTRKGRG